MTSNPESDKLAELPWPGPIEPREHVSEAIRRECTRDLAGRRGLGTAQRVALSLLVSAGVFGLLLYHGVATRPESAWRAALFGALGWSVVHIGLLVIGLARPPGRRGPRSLRWALVMGVPLAFLVYLGFAASGAVPFSEFIRGEHADWATKCGLFALFSGALASGATLLVWRGTDPLTPGLSGALAGVTGGLCGAYAMGCACSATEFWHVLFSHGLIVVALGTAGWLIGRRWLSP